MVYRVSAEGEGLVGVHFVEIEPSKWMNKLQHIRLYGCIEIAQTNKRLFFFLLLLMLLLGEHCEHAPVKSHETRV